MAVPLRRTSAVHGSRFAEYPPAGAARAVVAGTWEGYPRGPRRLRVLPDGCVDLVWDGARLRVTGAAVAPVDQPVGTPSAGLRLAAGAASGVLHVPAAELPPAGVELAALWDGRAGHWERRLGDAAGPAAVRRLLTELIAERLRTGHAPDPLVLHAAAAIGPLSHVDRIAADAGLSPRELRRRFHRDVGYGPKALQRVRRFGAFLARLELLAQGRRTPAELALELGYYDQAHLSRECRALSGANPGKLAALWRTHGAQRAQDQRAR